MSRTSSRMQDQERAESYSAGSPSEGNWTLLIVGYFAVLAVVIVLVRPLHVGIAGIFFAMMGAGVLLALLIFAVKQIIRRAARAQMSPRDLYHLAIGYHGLDADDEDNEDEEENDEPPPPAERDRGAPAHAGRGLSAVGEQLPGCDGGRHRDAPLRQIQSGGGPYRRVGTLRHPAGAL